MIIVSIDYAYDIPIWAAHAASSRFIPGVGLEEGSIPWTAERYRKLVKPHLRTNESYLNTLTLGTCPNTDKPIGPVFGRVPCHVDMSK
jgi:hypothetical protein